MTETSNIKALGLPSSGTTIIPMSGKFFPASKVKKNSLIREDSFIPAVNPVLARTGNHDGNIALVGTNGLVEGSYTSSSSLDGNSQPAYAFDGWEYRGGQGPLKINSNAGVALGQSTWRSTNPAFPLNSGDYIGDQWVRIDLGQAIVLDGFRIFCDWANGFPKVFNMEGSQNGSDWTVIQSYTNNQQAHGSNYGQYFPFSENTQPFRYFRIHITQTQEATHCEIDELELYAPL